MKRTIKLFVIFACVISLVASVQVNAISEKIVTENVTAKQNRLFEVKIGFNSSRTITASGFKLSYNKNDVVIREAVCNLSKAKVKLNDTNGSTDVIFLCSSGVKCKDFPVLFSVKYKKLNNKTTKVNISAYDCVDNNLKSFSPPEKAVCTISSDSSSAQSGGSNGGSGDTNDFDDSVDSDDGEDVLETSDNGSYAEPDNGQSVYFSGEDAPLYLKIIPIVFLVIILLFFILILYQNIQLKKGEKRREEEKKLIEDKEQTNQSNENPYQQ